MRPVSRLFVHIGCHREGEEQKGKLITELRNGNIEHTTLPSGLHLISEDFFGFRHGTSLPSDYSAIGELGNDSTNAGKGKGDGTWPGVALFRSRESEGGRGRRMISLGLVLGMSLPLLPIIASLAFSLENVTKDELMDSKPRGGISNLRAQTIPDCSL